MLDARYAIFGGLSDESGCAVRMAPFRPPTDSGLLVQSLLLFDAIVAFLHASVLFTFAARLEAAALSERQFCPSC